MRNNRRRMKRDKGQRLQRLRSERVECSFAHVCDSGGMPPSWLRGLREVAKRYRSLRVPSRLSPAEEGKLTRSTGW